ncbi:MAG TPA: phosphatase PAP2 family protein [Rhizomicrobium sp.]|nr:phosphatase PAP2 family protein [Rhizomicrobium sp.]
MLMVLAAARAGGGLFYSYVRKAERLAAMLMATAFLIGMSTTFSILNYLLLTVAGPRIDGTLAAVDRVLGVDWPAMMAVVPRHPLIDMGLQLVYISVLPQITVLVLCLGFWRKPEAIYRLCIAVAVGAAISMAVWTAALSFGAFSVYDLPSGVSRHLALALDGRHAHELVALLAHGPGRLAGSRQGTDRVSVLSRGAGAAGGLVCASAGRGSLARTRHQRTRPDRDADPGRASHHRRRRRIRSRGAGRPRREPCHPLRDTPAATSAMSAEPASL